MSGKLSSEFKVKNYNNKNKLALKSFYISSNTDEGCDDPFYDEDGNPNTNMYLKSCVDPNQPSVKPFCQKSLWFVNSEIIVIRTCGWEGSVQACHLEGGSWDPDTYVCR